MENLIEEKQIEETEEYEIAEMEEEMKSDPIYHLWNAIDYLDKANEILWNKGEQNGRDLILKALSSAKNALKHIKDE